MRPYHNRFKKMNPGSIFSGAASFFKCLFTAAILAAAIAAVSFAGVAHAREDLGRVESESLGLIIKYIEMVEDKPLLAAIFNIKTGRTIEYTIGDYVEGKLIRDILEDRVVLYDEITRHQFVLIFNDVVSAAEEEEKRETSIIRIKEKKRDIEEMNVTNIFNNELNKVQGKEPLKFGTPDSQQEYEAKQKQNAYTRDFKTNPDGFKNTPEQSPDGGPQSETGKTETPAGSVEVEVREKTPAVKGTGEVGVSASSSAGAKTSVGTGDTKPVELPVSGVSQRGKTTGETAPKQPQAGGPPSAANSGKGAGAAAPVQKTHDGTTVKIRDKANKAPAGDILEDK